LFCGFSVGNPLGGPNTSDYVVVAGGVEVMDFVVELMIIKVVVEVEQQ
jgi:hypothetical protein